MKLLTFKIGTNGENLPCLNWTAEKKCALMENFKFVADFRVFRYHVLPHALNLLLADIDEAIRKAEKNGYDEDIEALEDCKEEAISHYTLYYGFDVLAYGEFETVQQDFIAEMVARFLLDKDCPSAWQKFFDCSLMTESFKCFKGVTDTTNFTKEEKTIVKAGREMMNEVITQQVFICKKFFNATDTGVRYPIYTFSRSDLKGEDYNTVLISCVGKEKRTSDAKLNTRFIGKQLIIRFCKKNRAAIPQSFEYHIPERVAK